MAATKLKYLNPFQMRDNFEFWKIEKNVIERVVPTIPPTVKGESRVSRGYIHLTNF